MPSKCLRRSHDMEGNSMKEAYNRGQLPVSSFYHYNDIIFIKKGVIKSTYNCN